MGWEAGRGWGRVIGTSWSDILTCPAASFDQAIPGNIMLNILPSEIFGCKFNGVSFILILRIYIFYYFLWNCQQVNIKIPSWSCHQRAQCWCKSNNFFPSFSGYQWFQFAPLNQVTKFKMNSNTPQYPQDFKHSNFTVKCNNLPLFPIYDWARYQPMIFSHWLILCSAIGRICAQKYHCLNDWRCCKTIPGVRQGICHLSQKPQMWQLAS